LSRARAPAQWRIVGKNVYDDGMPKIGENPQGAGRPARKPVGAALLMLLAGWLVPGLGHLLQRRWGRAVAFFLVVGGLAVVGYLQRGFVFPAQSSDPFGLLGFLADSGTGIFYFFWKSFEVAGPDISRASGDYGTRFIATAGVLNILCAIDAYETCRWGRQ
jgi:hypothetical protein